MVDRCIDCDNQNWCGLYEKDGICRPKYTGTMTDMDTGITTNCCDDPFFGFSPIKKVNIKIKGVIRASELVESLGTGIEETPDKKSETKKGIEKDINRG